MKELGKMTLEELWQLFPITLTEHKPYWKDWYAEEVNNLKLKLPQNVNYYHIGSTAIKDIWAKPIIDIIIAVNTEEQLKQVSNILLGCGYLEMAKTKTRISFNKGYTKNGFAKKVYHLHIRLKNDVDEIYFRDYLIEHPEIAKEYEKLKLQLCNKFKYNRDAYTNAKTEFIKKYTSLGKGLV